MTSWTPAELRRFGEAEELEIATPGRDGVLTAFVPIWVVTTGDDVVVRTWYRRDTGWFGRAVRAGRARVRVPGLEADVRLDDVGTSTPERRAAVDRAYRTKYGRYGEATLARMVGDDAAQATLLLRRDRHDER